MRTALAVLIAGVWPSCLAQSDAQSIEHKVKAAYLYKFASYVEWPAKAFERPDSPIAIGVAGASPMAEELALVVTDRNVDGRKVIIHRVPNGESVAGLHMLFVGRSAPRAADLLAAAKGKPVLTITESEEAFGLGSIINLVMVEDKVRFDVALRPAEQNNLKVSSRLLGVARKVVGAS
ncbi:MAG: YfiR family protein [Betaproteobacteria bacterium]